MLNFPTRKGVCVCGFGSSSEKRPSGSLEQRKPICEQARDPRLSCTELGITYMLTLFNLYDGCVRQESYFTFTKGKTLRWQVKCSSEDHVTQLVSNHALISDNWDPLEYQEQKTHLSQVRGRLPAGVFRGLMAKCLNHCKKRGNKLSKGKGIFQNFQGCQLESDTGWGVKSFIWRAQNREMAKDSERLPSVGF